MYSYKPLETRLHAIGLNKSDLSTNLGISSRTIAKISKGEKIATNVLKKISDFLGCKIEDLFTEILDNHILQILRDEKNAKIKGGLYHETQVRMTYNSNHIEGSKLSEDDTRLIFETRTILPLGEAVSVDDVIETILMGMFYGSQTQTMMPKLYSTFHAGMELIRPLYYVKEADILSWKERNDLEFIQCACRFTENCTICDNGGGGSKREEMKKLIKDLRKIYKNIDVNIFRSVQNVNLDTIISYRRGDEVHHFLDDYDERGKAKQANITVQDTWGIDRFPNN